MLNFKDPIDVLQSEQLKKVITEFKRVQVSRFPIDVEFENHRVRFYDSRFPRDYGSRLAQIEVERDLNDNDEVLGEQFCIDSRLILNPRFVQSNERRHQKITKDTKKLFRYMRDYIRPLSAKEIAARSSDNRIAQLTQWRDQAGALVRDHCSISQRDVMQEVVRMKAMGYQPQTEKFAQLMTTGLESWTEFERRSKRSVMQVHVFINPDESIELHCSDKLGFANINQGITQYNSLAETPMCVQQHVAMLRMMEDKAFVPEVGTKVDANNYWVEVFPE